VSRLVAEGRCELVLCGSPDDVPLHDAVREAVGPLVAPHLHDFSTRVSLRETGALVAAMDLCVGVDTGLVHLAASHDVPVVVLFGPTDPNRWSPWTPRATVVRSPRLRQSLGDRLGLTPRRNHCPWPFGIAALADIAVADVWAAVAAQLPAPAPAPAIRTLDLRTGSFRYEVVAGLPAPAEAAAAARPATKPLAQAH
jgi:hypothetical protein